MPRLDMELRDFEVAHVRHVDGSIQTVVFTIEENSAVQIRQQISIRHAGSIEGCGESCVLFCGLRVFFPIGKGIVTGEKQGTRATTEGCGGQIVRRPFRGTHRLNEGSFSLLVNFTGAAGFKDLAGNNHPFWRLISRAAAIPGILLGVDYGVRCQHEYKADNYNAESFHRCWPPCQRVDNSGVWGPTVARRLLKLTGTARAYSQFDCPSNLTTHRCR